jgi:cell division protein FtsN
MRIKGSERSSILLLSRNTVLIGIVIIAVASFGLGYFFGYRGGGTPVVAKEDITAEQRELLPPEDRKVLAPSVEDKPVIMPPVVPIFPGDPVQGELPAAPPVEMPEKELLPKYKESEKNELPAAEPPKKPEPKAADVVLPKRVYTVQVGAFPSREGAERLQRMLKAKGVESYIVNGRRDIYFRVRVGSFESRREAERNAAVLQKKTGMKNFVTIR